MFASEAQRDTFADALQMEAQQEGQPAGAVANPLNDDGAAPRAEPREELEVGDERAWVALSLSPRAFARVGQWLSAADGAPTPLAWVMYAVLGLYPAFFLFVGIDG
eukprot:COSAG04_NODE_10719_length_757_cov_1.092705_2_plen_105_part_01